MESAMRPSNNLAFDADTTAWATTHLQAPLILGVFFANAMLFAKHQAWVLQYIDALHAAHLLRCSRA
jgi:hypothetical protein